MSAVSVSAHEDGYFHRRTTKIVAVAVAVAVAVQARLLPDAEMPHVNLAVVLIKLLCSSLVAVGCL